MTTISTQNDPIGPPASGASVAVLAEHSDARWADWARRGIARDSTGLRRTQIIASVIGLGVLAWLFATIR